MLSSSDKAKHKKRKWTEEEKQIVRLGAEIYGRDWKKIRRIARSVDGGNY